MPTTGTPADDPLGTATQGPPIMGFVFFISAFAVVYWIFRAWFVRLDPDS